MKVSPEEYLLRCYMDKNEGHMLSHFNKHRFSFLSNRSEFSKIVHSLYIISNVTR
jgi:hypothetical protein